MAKIELGMVVRDKITKITGTVVARTEYLTGCVHVSIIPDVKRPNGRAPEWQSFNENQVDIIKTRRRVTLNKSDNPAAKGGPAPAVAKM